jgi:hypothetical protein
LDREEEKQIEEAVIKGHPERVAKVGGSRDQFTAILICLVFCSSRLGRVNSRVPSL